MASEPVKHPRMRRADLYKIFRQRGYLLGAEIGVLDGVNAADILSAVPGVRLYLVDPYADYPGAGRCRSRARYKVALQRAKEFTKGGDVCFLKMKSLAASLKFTDGSLDFVYIDGSHLYAMAMLDQILWTPKVRKGGIVSGHDYYCNRNGVQVKRAVDDFARAHGFELHVTDKFPVPQKGNYDPFEVMRTGDRDRSWWWNK